MEYRLAKHVNLPKGEQEDFVAAYENELNELANEANPTLRGDKIELGHLRQICEDAYIFLYGKTMEERGEESDRRLKEDLEKQGRQTQNGTPKRSIV